MHAIAEWVVVMRCDLGYTFWDVYYADGEKPIQSSATEYGSLVLTLLIVVVIRISGSRSLASDSSS